MAVPLPGDVVTDPVGGGRDEPPQAIADDYPGWGVTCERGRWTVWCPAVTVDAVTVADLRAGIEYAITGDDDD
jgi:hypothetical protein